MGGISVDIGTVKGYEVAPNKDGDDNVLLLQVEFTNPDDLQTVEWFRSSGVDSVPQTESRVIVVDLADDYRVAIALDDGSEPTVSEGERELYSYDEARTRQAQINLAADGTITINNANTTITIDSSGEVTIDAGSNNVNVNAAKLTLNSSADAAALASKVDLLWSTLDTVFRTAWIVAPMDGGAALKAAYIAAFATPPSSVASTKLEVDG